MPTVHLGNPAPAAPEVTGRSVTTAQIPDVYTHSEILRTIFHEDGLWAQHSTAPFPAWVECDDPVLTEAIAARAGCPVGRPGDWQ